MTQFFRRKRWQNKMRFGWGVYLIDLDENQRYQVSFASQLLKNKDNCSSCVYDNDELHWLLNLSTVAADFVVYSWDLNGNCPYCTCFHARSCSGPGILYFSKKYSICCHSPGCLMLQAINLNSNQFNFRELTTVSG